MNDWLDRAIAFTAEGITNQIIEGRRTSSYFIPIAKPKKIKGGGQLQLYATDNDIRKGFVKSACRISR